jgi:GT2 family glycosyltransferase
MRRILAPEPERGLRPGPVPTFSVVIPAFKAAATIAEAVESVIAQTLPPLEIIVCDDGSPDDLRGVLRPYRSVVTLVAGPHKGVSAARNMGIRSARGDFVVFLDADDIFLPERLEALADLAARRPDLDLVTTDAYFERDGKLVGRFYEYNAFPLEDQRRVILERNFLLVHTAVRRSLLLACGGFDPSLSDAEDWECWIRLLLGGARAGLVDEALSVYRLRGDSLSSNRARSLRGRVLALQRAARHPSLTASERQALAASLASHLRRARVAEAEAALLCHLPGRRRRLMPLVTGSGFGLRTRAKAAAALVAPGLAAAYLRRRSRDKGSRAETTPAGLDPEARRQSAPRSS